MNNIDLTLILSSLITATSSLLTLFFTNRHNLLSNDQNLNLDNLVVELYKNEIFIKEIRDYQFIDDLESDQEYIIKYYYQFCKSNFFSRTKLKTSLLKS